MPLPCRTSPRTATRAPTRAVTCRAIQEEKVIKDLGPMLRASGLGTGILAYDHNWAEYPKDIASTPPDEISNINDYPQEVLSSPAARWVSGVSYHCYYGDPSAMTALHNQFPHKDIYQTECSGSQSRDPANTFSDTLKWQARNLEIGSPRNWSKTVVNWNVALDLSGGPHVGGCGTCTGILTVGPGGTVTPGAEYYALGQLSRFVQPGAVRIASTSFGTTGWNGQIMDVAFVNPNGSTVLVADNENDSPRIFSVRENGQRFDYTLPGDSLATFVWDSPPSRHCSCRRWTSPAGRRRRCPLARSIRAAPAMSPAKRSTAKPRRDTPPVPRKCPGSASPGACPPPAGRFFFSTNTSTTSRSLAKSAIFSVTTARPSARATAATCASSAPRRPILHLARRSGAWT